MALASCAGEISIYDDFISNTNFHPHVVDLHHGGVNGLSWSSNAKVLASCGDDGTIKLFHPPKLEPLREMSHEDHSIIPFNDIEFSPTSQYLAAASADSVVRIWPLQTKQQINMIKHSWHGNSVNTVTWSHDDQLVVSGCDGGSILLFQRETQTILAPISSELKSAINVLKFSPLKHSLLGEGNRDGDLRVWDIQKQQTTVEFPQAHYNSCTSFAFSKVNKMLLVSGGMDATLRFFDITQKTRIKQLKLDSPVTSLDFYSDGFTIAVGDIDGTISLIDLREANNKLLLYKAHTSRVNEVAFTPRKKGAATHGPPKMARNTSSTQLNKQNSAHNITAGSVGGGTTSGGITASIRAVTNPGSQSNSPKKTGSPKRYSSSGKKASQNKQSSFSTSYRKESADKITLKRRGDTFIDQSISVRSESESQSHARNISEVRAQVSQRQLVDKQNSFTRQEAKEQNQSSRMFKFETSKANNSFRGSPAIFTKQKAQPFKFSNITDEISPPPQDGFNKMFLS